MRYVLLLVVLLGCGPQPIRPRAAKPECNGCDAFKVKLDRWYVANFTFVDHTGKKVSFCRKMLAEKGKQSHEPLYRIKGTQPSGQEVYYYAVDCPEKKTTGLTEFTTITGAEVMVDFTSMEVTRIPVTQQPLDPYTKSLLEEWEKYRTMQRSCPVHRYRDDYYGQKID